MEINVLLGSSTVKFVYKSREDEEEANSSVRNCCDYNLLVQLAWTKGCETSSCYVITCSGRR